METKTLNERGKRVRILKRLIVGTILGFIILPTILCVILFFRFYSLQKEFRSLTDAYLAAEEDRAGLQKQIGEQTDRLTEADQCISSLQADLLAQQTEEPAEPEEAEEEQPRPRKVYLTFDDGPSGHTQKILDILDAYGVKGNFFVCATANEDYLKFYQQILDRGHMLGLHSYSHVYDEIYASDEAFREDVLAIREFVKEQTGGFEATYYRFPGGSSNLHARISLASCEEWLASQGLVYYDWNISSQDATNPMQSTEAILHNATYGSDQFEEVVVLMHDLGNKDSTVEALPQIISYYQDIGAKISVIDENSMRIQHDK
ncbi:MAG: polysaccharide deacetylase [Lachnospiraceae bacterium]|nr:polysaccharide deacetylase [Lachnospiraceae bacterium]